MSAVLDLTAMAKQLHDHVFTLCNIGMSQKSNPHDHSKGPDSQTYTFAKTLWLND